MKFSTKLWKRSQKSFATTIPHIVLLGLDESKEHDVVWEFDSVLKKWTFSLEPKEKRASGATGRTARKAKDGGLESGKSVSRPKSGTKTERGQQ